MQDRELLLELLDAEDEDSVMKALQSRKLLQEQTSRWTYLGGMPNNQSIVHNQQSTPAAALVEKITNAIDAILLRHCKAKGVNPRSEFAPPNMAKATELYFGDLASWEQADIRALAEANLLMYATGSKSRPSISLYDAGEGQLQDEFPKTFCSLIYGSSEGSYKGAIPFVQGRFNMGGTGVLPFCSEGHKLQLILSRAPKDVAKSDAHEWAFTICCFFASKQNPSWKYLVGTDGKVLTAGTGPLGLIPKKNAKSGELCAPRERLVESGTLIKMYDYKAARSNICGEQFKKLQEYLLRPALPLRLVECREAYKANVMQVTVWDRLSSWGSGKLEDGFEDGASISIKLDSGETVPAEVRVFKANKELAEDENQPQTGLRALINGQSHAKRDAQFFRTKAVDKEHIAGSMLVTLDCTELGQDSRNALFMSNRETFREDPLLTELFKKLQKELHDHEGLDQLNQSRYEEKIKNAVNDNEGIKALEELLETDPALAELFGSMVSGKVAAKTSIGGPTNKQVGKPVPFNGTEFPSFIHRSDKTTAATAEVEAGNTVRISFLTDVKNNYFTRQKLRGKCEFSGDVTPTHRLFNGRLTFTFNVDKDCKPGSQLNTNVLVTDKRGSGPFKLSVQLKVTEKQQKEPPTTTPPKTPIPHAGPSRPDIKEVENGPDAPPLTIERIPNTDRLQLVLNIGSSLLVAAKKMRPPEEEAAVVFVFKYGLALAAMGLLDSAKGTEEWKSDEAKCREQIQRTAIGIARVIVPLCLSLPQKLPKPKS